jgi:protocatechuate 3,4-dioxygenase alpha subunit
MQAPHLVLLVFARGLLKPVLTRMYFPDEEEANVGDVVLSGVEDPAPLVAAQGPDGLEFDLRLQGDGAVVAFAV